MRHRHHHFFIHLLSPRLTPRSLRSFSSCPFQTLGLKTNHHYQSSRAPLKPSSITYEQVRVAFRKLALVHHPDTANKESIDGEACNKGSFNEFNRIREAFEAIDEGPGGIALLRDNSLFESSRDHNATSGNASDSNGKSNTSHHDTDSTLLHASLNPSILREVAEVADLSPGGLDRGGMWQYATMVRRKQEEQDLPPLRVEGTVVRQKKRRCRRK